MNFNPHTQRIRSENESQSLGQTNSSQKVSQNFSESKTTKTTHIALHCLELRVSRLHDERTHSVSNLEELKISCQEGGQEKIKMLWESFPLKILIIYVPFNRREDWETSRLGKSQGCEIMIGYY